MMSEGFVPVQKLSEMNLEARNANLVASFRENGLDITPEDVDEIRTWGESDISQWAAKLEVDNTRHFKFFEHLVRHPDAKHGFSFYARLGQRLDENPDLLQAVRQKMMERDGANA